MGKRGKEANMSEKLACALLALRDSTGKPLVDREWAKTQTPKSIIGLFQFDHIIYKTWEGSNHPTNLVPLITKTHRQQTSKKDVPAIAKSKRLTKKQEEFRGRLLAKAEGTPKQKPKGKHTWPSRKMRSRSSFEARPS